MNKKTLNNVNVKEVKERVSDVEIFGNGDLWRCINKASSKKQGWMKSTKVMEINGVGCLVQVTTQQYNDNGSWSVAEAVTFVPGVEIRKDDHGCPYLEPYCIVK